ncbi:hypothetical protein MUP37_01170 [Candidatus Bathyarchaeota archaeon]|nr:hypothetical protein [Candidatus Bathyarchaeota archaeon]
MECLSTKNILNGNAEVVNVNRISKIALSLLLIITAVGSLYLGITQFLRQRTFKILLPSLGRGMTGEKYVMATLNCSLPEIPDRVPFLRVVRREYTDAGAKSVATEVFGMTGELNVTRPAISSNGTVIRVVNGTQTLEMYEDGALRYIPNFQEAGYNITLPELSQAKEIVVQSIDRFLKKAESSCLKPNCTLQIVFFKVDYACWYAIPPSPTVPVEIRVSYKVLYDAIPLIFKGSFYVTIGDSGKILEFRCYWRNVEPADRLSITVTPEQAIENMGNNSDIVGRNPRQVREITINSVQLGYFTPSPLLRTDKLLPAYEIMFVATFEDGFQSTYETYVSSTTTSIPY